MIYGLVAVPGLTKGDSEAGPRGDDWSGVPRQNECRVPPARTIERSRPFP